MTKKDYQLLARVVNRHYGITLGKFIDELAKELKEDNDRFNADRFKEACFDGAKVI